MALQTYAAYRDPAMSRNTGHPYWTVIVEGYDSHDDGLPDSPRRVVYVGNQAEDEHRAKVIAEALTAWQPTRAFYDSNNG